MIDIKTINKSNNDTPEYATEGAAGVDLRAHIIEGAITLDPMERALIPTGLFLEIPKGLEAQIRPRSGLAIKYGITILNTPGTIDSDYRGEVCVILINLGKEPFKIYNGDRIAQMIITNHDKVNFKLTEELSNTVRGEGGFGSTKI
jgi:dUTP pyrophosphatase